MAYPDAAWERTMTIQEMMLKALSGELHWFRAAEILGWSPRTLRRWREATRRTAIVAWSISACSGRRPGGSRRGRWSRCYGCIGSTTRI
jgi:hypothetical protein